MKGWEGILYDKCKNNSVTDIQLVNMPSGWDIPPKPPKNAMNKTPEPECRTFIYAAYLPPGNH